MTSDFGNTEVVVYANVYTSQNKARSMYTRAVYMQL